MEEDIGSLVLTLHVGESFTLIVEGQGTAHFQVAKATPLWTVLEYSTDWEDDDAVVPMAEVRLELDEPWEFRNGTDEPYLTITFRRQDGIRAKLRLEAPRKHKIERPT